MTRRVWASALMFGALIASACGSTLQAERRSSAQAERRSSAVAGLDGVSSDGAESTQTLDGPGAATGSVGSEGGSSLRTTGPGTAGSTTRVRPGGAAGSAPGSPTATGKLTIGIELESGAAETRAAFGIDVEPVDEETMYRAVADYINANGGMGGRQVEVVFHYTNASNGTWEAQGQAACTAFTEDKKVFAVISGVNRSESMAGCLAQNNTPFLHYMIFRFTPVKLFDEWSDFLYLPLSLNYDRGAVFVDALAAQGFFGKTNKIGLLTIDHPYFTVYSDQVIKPRLRALGYEITAEALIYAPPSVADLGQSAADVSSAVLRFRTLGIDRVLFTNTAGVGPIFFMPQAESQNYRPLYGIASWEYPQTLAGTVPIAQLRNTRGIGWSMGDMPAVQRPPPTGARQRCREIVRKAGLTDTQDTGCDPLFLLDAALDRSRTFTPAGLRAGVEPLTTYDSTTIVASGFSPTRRHDGVTGYRLLRFEEDCACFKHSGPQQRVP